MSSHRRLTATAILIAALTVLASSQAERTSAPDARQVQDAMKRATSPQVIPLWPEGVPGAIAGGGAETSEDGRVSNVHQPTLTLYAAPAQSQTGTAIIICRAGATSVSRSRRRGVRWPSG